MFNLKSATIGAAMCIAAASLTTGPAQAALISIADSQGAFLGPDVVTFDDATNLEWLDLTFSTNLSFADAVAQFGAGGTFEGWRHATEIEIVALFTNGGFPPPTTTSPATQEMLDLIAQLGRTAGFGPEAPDIPGGDSFNHTTQGHYTSTFGARLEAAQTCVFGTCVPEIGRATVAEIFFGDPFDTTGHWLVRSPLPPTTAIPAPAGILIFGPAVLLLGAMRKRTLVRRA